MIYGNVYLNEAYNAESVYGSDWEVGFTEAFNTISNMMGILESADILLEGEGSSEQKKKLSERIKAGFDKIIEAIKEAFKSFCKSIKEKCNEVADKLIRWYEEHNISRVLVDQYVKNWDYKKEIEEVKEIIKNCSGKYLFGHLKNINYTNFYSLRYQYDKGGLDDFFEKIDNKINDISKSEEYSAAVNMYNDICTDCKNMEERINNSKSMMNIFFSNLQIQQDEIETKNSNIKNEIDSWFDTNDYDMISYLFERDHSVTNEYDIETMIEYIQDSKKKANIIKNSYNFDIDYAKRKVDSSIKDIEKIQKHIKEDTITNINKTSTSKNTFDYNPKVSYDISTKSMKNDLLAAKAKLKRSNLYLKYVMGIKKINLRINFMICTIMFRMLADTKAEFKFIKKNESNKDGDKENN